MLLLKCELGRELRSQSGSETRRVCRVGEGGVSEAMRDPPVIRDCQHAVLLLARRGEAIDMCFTES